MTDDELLAELARMPSLDETLGELQRSQPSADELIEQLAALDWDGPWS